ncbi:MAG: flagellar hook-length control protein FliK, partial [Lachnospiraceae bacterium]
VEAVEVTVESHAFEDGATFNQNNAYSEQQEQAAGRTRRSLRLDSLDDLSLEELTEEEQIVLDMMEQEGNRVNFMA